MEYYSILINWSNCKLPYQVILYPVDMVSQELLKCLQDKKYIYFSDELMPWIKEGYYILDDIWDDMTELEQQNCIKNPEKFDNIIFNHSGLDVIKYIDIYPTRDVKLENILIIDSFQINR